MGYSQQAKLSLSSIDFLLKGDPFPMLTMERLTKELKGILREDI